MHLELYFEFICYVILYRYDQQIRHVPVVKVANATTGVVRKQDE